MPLIRDAAAAEASGATFRLGKGLHHLELGLFDGDDHELGDTVAALDLERLTGDPCWR